MNHRGFSIVELMVVITVLATLLVLGTVNLRGSQDNATDAERKTDIESIGFHLEAFYKSGTDGSTTIGRYPSTALVVDSTSITQMLRDIDPKSFRAPGVETGTSLVEATNDTQTTAGVMPQPTTSQYVYQPIQNNGALCTLETQECRKFNLYFRLATDNTVYMVTSKNQ